jgi:hypothetical protein
MSDDLADQERKLRYIRGIVRNRCEFFYDDSIAMRHLRTAHNQFGVSLDALTEMTKGINRWSDFTDGIQNLIFQKTGLRVTKFYDIIGEEDNPDD